MLKVSLFAGCVWKKYFRSRSNVDLLYELDLAGLASLMSWLKHRLGHGLPEEGGKTCFDYHVFHASVICMPDLVRNAISQLLL